MSFKMNGIGIKADEVLVDMKDGLATVKFKSWKEDDYNLVRGMQQLGELQLLVDGREPYFLATYKGANYHGTHLQAKLLNKKTLKITFRYTPVE